MDPNEARDYANQFPYPDSPDSPGGINDENLEILAAVLKCITECIDEADFGRPRAFGRPSPGLTYRTSSCCNENSARSDSVDLLCNIMILYMKSYYDIIYSSMMSYYDIIYFSMTSQVCDILL